MITVHKAQPRDDRAVPSAMIVIEEEITPARPRYGGIDSVPLFKEEAEYLEGVLCGALPGGTYDRLLVRMLERKASHLIVSYDPFNPLHSSFGREPPDET